MKTIRAGLRVRTAVWAGVVVAGLAMLGSVAPGAGAQAGMMCHSMGMQDEIAPDKLPVPEKLSGIGNVHIKITGSPEAQMWFDQGLNLYHDFWDYESARAFEQSVRVDPQCAMCYWGLYLALSMRNSDDRYAGEAIAKAVSLKGHASKSERLYIEASAAGAAAAKDKKDDDGESQEVQILRKLVKRSPKDTQARIFLGWSLMDGYDDDGNPKKNTKEGLTILQGVLRAEPENSAANHYWIHAVEASPRPEQALHSAEILGRLAPASGHMVHMPGHIFYRTGDYASAEKSFAASTVADETYMQAQHVQVDDDWNYVHNLMYAIANLMEEGRLTEATALSAKLKEARGQFAATLYLGTPRDSISRLDPRLPVAMRAADWARVVEWLKAAPAPPAQHSNLTFLAQGLMEFASGMKALDDHDLPQAEDASRRLDAELWRASEQMKDEEAAKDKAKKKDEDTTKMAVMPDARIKPLVSNLSIMSLELRAGLLMAKKQIDDAKKLYAQAAREEKELGYREPPVCIRPVAETEAAEMLKAAAWTDAKAAYQKALVERPKSGFALYGLALSSERGGDAKAASVEYAEFVTAWKRADAGLPELEHARAFLAEHGGAIAGR